MFVCWCEAWPSSQGFTSHSPWQVRQMLQDEEGHSWLRCVCLDTHACLGGWRGPWGQWLACFGHLSALPQQHTACLPAPLFTDVSVTKLWQLIHMHSQLACISIGCGWSHCDRSLLELLMVSVTVCSTLSGCYPLRYWFIHHCTVCTPGSLAVSDDCVLLPAHDAHQYMRIVSAMDECDPVLGC